MKIKQKITPLSIIRIIMFSFCIIIFSCTTNNYNGNNPDCSSTSIIVGTTYTNSSVNSTSGTITVTSPLSSDYTYKINSGSYQVNPTFTNLAQGTYIITAKNSNGCTGATSVTITAFDCSSTYINPTATTTTNSITVTNPLGSNYTYSLNGASFQSSPIFSGLGTGTYTITARDNNGCTGSNTFDVNVCYSSAQRDTGSHMVFIDALNPGLSPISDTLDAIFSGNTLHMSSKALGRTLTGTKNTDNCNNFILDSLIFTAGDTLRISSSTLPVPGGIIKIWNIRAGGFVNYNATGCATQVNIAKGNTNISSPINLTNLAGLKMNLRGNFLKL